MYTENEIIEILKKVIDASKRADQQRIRSYYKHQEYEVPDYYPSYKKCKKMMDKIKIHAEICERFPKELFIKKSPNMTPEEYEYIENNYKQSTLPVYLDLLSTVNRIFHDSNWDISYANDESKESLREYVEEDIQLYGSIENFVKASLPHLKLTDANGIIVIKPFAIKEFQNEQGEYVVDSSAKLDPIPFYFSCTSIVSENLQHAMVELDEKSEVSYGNKKMKIGRVFEFYDEVNMWKITQTGNFVDYTFDYRIFYEHGRNELPYKKLMGIPAITSDGILYQSPFSYVTDILDLVAINSTVLDLVIKKCGFPFTVMYGNICEFENVMPNGERLICNGGKVFYDGGDVLCTSCGGTGTITKVTPLRTMLLRPPTSTQAGDDKFSQAPIQYVAPDTAILDFLMKKIADDESRARNMLHLNTSTTQITNQMASDPTATGMVLDLKALYAFVKPISDQLFTLWEFIIDWTRYIRYGEDYPAPVFSYPISFDFHTGQDYLNEISRGQQAKLPPSIMDTIIKKYLQSSYYNEKDSARYFNLVTATDRLLSISNDDILLKLARGVVEKWEVIVHDSAMNLILDLFSNNDKFFDQDIEKQKADLIALAKTKAVAVPAAVSNVQNILNATGGGG